MSRFWSFLILEERELAAQRKKKSLQISGQHSSPSIGFPCYSLHVRYLWDRSITAITTRLKVEGRTRLDRARDHVTLFTTFSYRESVADLHSGMAFWSTYFDALLSTPTSASVSIRQCTVHVVRTDRSEVWSTISSHQRRLNEVQQDTRDLAYRTRKGAIDALNSAGF